MPTYTSGPLEAFLGKLEHRFGDYDADIAEGALRGAIIYLEARRRKDMDWNADSRDLREAVLSLALHWYRQATEPEAPTMFLTRGIRKKIEALI